MGTFHEGLGELHGITVLVETVSGDLIVGRCHEANAQHALILDADRHAAGQSDPPRSQWLEAALKWGVFPRQRVVDLPAGQVRSIRPLGQVKL